MRQHDARFIALIMALLLGCPCVSTVAIANSLAVDGNGLSAIDGDGKGFTSPQKVLLPGADSQTVALDDLRSATVIGSPGFHTETTLLGEATARYGTLSGFVSLQAISLPGGHQAQTRASFVVSFDDTATVLSSTLPVGTPVTLDFTGEMASSVSVTGLPNYNHGGVLYEGFIRDLSTGTSTNFTLTNDRVFGPTPAGGVVTRTLATVVGHELEFIGRLSLGGELQLVFDETEASAAVDAAHTAHLYFHPSPSSDVTLLTASGHNYAIPEPSGVVLILCAGMLLGWPMVRASRWRKALHRRD